MHLHTTLNFSSILYFLYNAMLERFRSLLKNSMELRRKIRCSIYTVKPNDDNDTFLSLDLFINQSADETYRRPLYLQYLYTRYIQIYCYVLTVVYGWKNVCELCPNTIVKRLYIVVEIELNMEIVFNSQYYDSIKKKLTFASEFCWLADTIFRDCLIGMADKKEVCWDDAALLSQKNLQIPSAHFSKVSLF